MRRLFLNAVPRCLRCRLPTRWCVCAGQCDIVCPLQIDVLMHDREYHRPSSTGHLITRAFPTARLHPWRQDRVWSVDELRVPGRELWVLHPHGAPAPTNGTADAVQLLLLDGSWSEASAMAKTIGERGRLVSLPMAGESRYWLRDQQDGGRFSTAEALIFLLRTFSLSEAADRLMLQLELHVYAHLRARGRRETAAMFLQHSPLRTAMPGLLAQLNARRPR